MNLKVILSFILCFGLLFSVSFATSEEDKSPRILVAYFSRADENYSVGIIEKGNTEIVAEMIAEFTGADLFKIERDTPYPFSYEDVKKEAQQELSTNARPALKESLVSLDSYDIIYLGTPIWWGEMPMPVYTFVESLDFDGKIVYPFTTHGGSGLARVPQTLSKLCTGADVTDGLAIRGSDAQNQPEDVRADVLNWVSQHQE